jgi:hypothetical protein
MPLIEQGGNSVYKVYTNELTHFGVLGMKWGHHKAKVDNLEFHKESSKKIITNKDGSTTIPSGFTFNRVGKQTLDVNKSGGLYVSYGKDDAARYIKSLGPTPIAKLLGNAGEAVQHITVKSNIKMPSDSEMATQTGKLLLSDPKLFKSFNESLYSLAVTGDLNKQISRADVEKAIKNPSGKEGQKLAYGVSSFLGDENYTKESKSVYNHFKKQGYDAIPDVHDRLSGTSKTAMIVLNHDKIKVESTTTISKDVMKQAKQHVKDYNKKYGKLKVSELIS